nr:MAG TPA: hypothetical protein [Caudoviricetes sp.]
MIKVSYNIHLFQCCLYVYLLLLISYNLYN